MAEIRFRGERRLGELVAAQRDAGMMASGAKGVGPIAGPQATRNDAPITLAEAGIDKHLADRARKFAAAVTLASVTASSSVTEKINEINKHDAYDTYDACLGAS